MADPQEIRSIMQRKFIPAEVRLQQRYYNLKGTWDNLRATLQISTNPQAKKLLNLLSQYMEHLDASWETFHRAESRAQRAMTNYVSTLTSLRASPMREKVHMVRSVQEAREQAYQAVLIYLDERDRFADTLASISPIIQVFWQSLSVERKAPRFCPNCNEVFSASFLLSHDVSLRILGVEESRFLGVRRVSKKPQPEDIKRVLDTCPHCGGKLELIPTFFLKWEGKEPVHPLARKARYSIDVLPKAPVRMRARLAIFPPYIPKLPNARDEAFIKGYIRRRMHELKNRIPRLLEQYVQTKLRTPALVAGYMRSVRISIDSDNVILVEIVKPLGLKLELGKERYPLWNVIRKFKHSKEGYRYAVIPLRISFNRLQKNLGTKERFAFSRFVVAPIKKSMMLSRARLMYYSSTGYRVHTSYFSTRKMRNLPNEFKGEVKYFSRVPKAEEIAELLRKRFHSIEIKSYTKIYREGTLRRAPSGRYREISSGLVWFRTLREDKAATSFIIPEVKPIYALDYLAEVAFNEVQRIATNLSQHPSLSPESRFVGVLPHEVVRLYGSSVQSFTSHIPIDIALEQGATLEQIEDVEEHQESVGKAVRRKFPSQPYGRESSVPEHWYSSVLGAGKLG